MVKWTRLFHCPVPLPVARPLEFGWPLARILGRDSASTIKLCDGLRIEASEASIRRC